jgi:hypothetical protein
VDEQVRMRLADGQDFRGIGHVKQHVLRAGPGKRCVLAYSREARRSPRSSRWYSLTVSRVLPARRSSPMNGSHRIGSSRRSCPTTRT